MRSSIIFAKGFLKRKPCFAHAIRCTRESFYMNLNGAINHPREIYIEMKSAGECLKC